MSRYGGVRWTWKKISLSELEDDKFNLSSSEGDQKPTLVAKFFTRRAINVEEITRTFKPLWRIESGFLARDLGDNLVMFKFDDAANLERVLLYEPWSFDKHLVAFRRFEGQADPEMLVFNQTTFWVQIHNLPILSLKNYTVVSLGIGKYILQFLFILFVFILKQFTSIYICTCIN